MLSVPLQLLYFASLAAAACYWPDGTQNYDVSYQPCHSDRPSMCCATNRSYYVNYCLDSGLCNQPTEGEVWREQCSDPTWKDPACLHLCTKGNSTLLKPAELDPWSSVGILAAFVD